MGRGSWAPVRVVTMARQECRGQGGESAGGWRMGVGDRDRDRDRNRN